MMKTTIVPWPNLITEQLINDKLGALLGDNNDAKLFSEIAHAIDAPTSLHGFITALENFRGVIPSIVDYLESNESAIWSDRMRAIDTLLKRINYEEIDSNLLSKNHWHSCASNPLYALFLRMEFINLRQDLCDKFVAQFYLNYMKLWAQASENTRERAGLAMRSTSEGRGFDTTAFDEFQQMLDPSEGNVLIESLERFEDQYASTSLITNKGVIQPTAKQYIRVLILLFAGKLGKKKGGGGTRGGGSRLADLPINQNIPTDLAHTVDEEDEDETGLGNSRVHHDIGQEQRKSSVTLGTAPGDATSGVEAVTEEVSPKKSVKIATDKKRMKLRSAQIANAIAISNQFLPTQWRQLNTYDIQILVKELIELSVNDDAKTGMPSSLLAASIASSFARGMPLDYITKMKVVTKKIKSGDNHVLLRSKGNQWIAKWMINGSINIPNGRKSNLKMAGLCRPIDENKTITLNAPAWVAHLLGTAKIKRDKLDLANRQRMLFPDTCGDYVLAAKKWLKKIRRKYPACRLTLNRIECYFVQCCMQYAKFDLAETAYCHGRVHIIQETQLYYTAVAKERIAYIYNQVWMQIDNLIQKEDPTLKPIPSASSQQVSIGDYRNAAAFLGSEITPTAKAVTDLVSFLKNNIGEAKAKTNPHWKKTIAYHNAYTTYTMFFLAYASGYRAAQSPFPDPRFLDEKTGFLVISDKDFDDSYCTRIIWLPPECVQQMKYYQAHLESIVDKLCLINKQSFNALYTSFDGWNTLPKLADDKMRMDASEFENPPFLFYLNDAGECNPVTPGLLGELIHDVYPFPINANRHYLRTELVERRCPRDILDAFMGHWQRGREAWGKYSSLSPSGYSTAIEPKLKEILRENGWCAIRSIET